MQTVSRISEIEERTAFDHIAPGVTGLRIVMVNVYAVANPDGSWVLIDAGLYFSAHRIRRWAERYFGTSARPSAIVLTHGHFDHVGALRDLAEAWDVPVYAHSMELPYLTGRSQYPPPDPTVGGGVMAAMSWMYPRGPINLGRRVTALPADGSVPGLPGWRWIHTPGHTAGHVSLFRDEDRVLIAGDAFVTTKQESLGAVLSQRLEFHGPPSYYTSDWEAAELSVQRLAGLQPQVIACGHGQPVLGPEATDRLDSLAETFHFREIPVGGRYVGRPAVTDERGLVKVPPPVSNPVPALVVIAIVAGAVWFALSRRSRR